MPRNNHRPKIHASRQKRAVERVLLLEEGTSRSCYMSLHGRCEDATIETDVDREEGL